MNDQLIAAIQSFTLATRALLERETEEQLQGLYGWLPDGSFGKGTALSLPSAATTRAQLESFVAAEISAGITATAAREKLKRETAFTWLNRAVAFRMMEERGILKSTLGKLHKSNAFIFWLTDVKGLASLPASTPVDALGEGPVDSAYREFLLWQCSQLAAEVSVLFDPQTLASSLCPRPSVLKELVESMQTTEVADAWRAGNEETIGWVYEAFIENDNAAVFGKFSKGKKVLPEDIGAATQRFTPRWIVRYLIENSIGRIWVEMHPDSRLGQSLDYLVPLRSPQGRAVKPVKEITFLDPSCGSMHFGLLAFDLFVEMYREERENAGKPGWPAVPSAVTDEAIPELILAHNIHGIDIDLRAVQTSALALLLKARMLNPKARLTDHNLACANIEAFTGGHLDELISAASFNNRIEEKILRALAARVADSPHLGSLLRLERDLKSLVESERARLLASSQPELLLAGLTDDLFESTRDLDSFFDTLAATIAAQLDTLTKQAGAGSRHTAAEAAKGLRFLRLAEQRYDVVATNPPYLSRRNMSDVMAKYLDNTFASSKGDLYAAFIMRGAELLNQSGLLGMVTQQSFMFISSYETMRSEMRQCCAVESMVHLGPRAFPNISGEKVNTAAFILRREPDAQQRDGQIGTYFRLVKERDANAKRLAFESALAALRNGEPHHQIFHYLQEDFDAFPKIPWVYWSVAGVKKAFLDFPPCSTHADFRAGMHGGDFNRFGRLWWEVGISRIGVGATSIDEFHKIERKWAPFMKGGAFKKWWGNQEWVLAFDHSHYRILSDCGNKLPSKKFYFRKGVTWNSMSSVGLSVRLMPEGFIFSDKSDSAFTEKPLGLLGLMNSKSFAYMASLISPTIDFHSGYVGAIPGPIQATSQYVVTSGIATDLCMQDSRESETTYDFIQPLRAISDRAARKEQLASLEAEIDAEVSRLYGLSEEDLAAIDRELNVPTSSDGNDDAEAEETPDEDEDEASGDLSPADWARSWVSYALGTVLGRFEIGEPGGLGCGDFPEATVTAIRRLMDPDGIMPCDAGHPQDIAARAVACLEVMLGAAEARERVRLATDAEGDSVEALRGWLDRFTGQPAASFWKYHHQLYRKRPVYWPFQSPKKSFTTWVFHERIGPNTLHTLKDLTDVRLNLLEREIADLRPAAATNRAKAKELDKRMDQADDLREFAARLKAHIDAGYESCIDDGVLLNAAPLHDLLPSWPDCRAAWKDLESGKFDWAQQAMRHWPERVTDACRTNRSFAIAHGVEHLCPPDPPNQKRGRKKA
jgi:hypothetical protein